MEKSLFEQIGGVSVARQKHTLEERVQAVRELLEDGKDKLHPK